MAEGTATYEVAALSNQPVTFTPGILPHPAVDGVGIVNGQYFALAAQLNPTQNGIWYADAAGPVPIQTVAQGLDPNTVVTVTGGTVNNNTTWVYSATSHNGGPGLVAA